MTSVQGKHNQKDLGGNQTPFSNDRHSRQQVLDKEGDLIWCLYEKSFGACSHDFRQHHHGK